MARLTTDLSARLWSDGICTRWMTIRGFAYLTTVPPLPSFSERDPDVISATSGDAWAPTAMVCRLLLPVASPATSAFPRKGFGSAYREYPLKRHLSGANFRGCSHFVMFRPLRLLATWSLSTSTVSSRAVCDFYLRAEHGSLPSHASDRLAVRTRQLTARGLSPR